MSVNTKRSNWLVFKGESRLAKKWREFDNAVGYTVRSQITMSEIFARVVQIAEHFHVTCEIEVPYSKFYGCHSVYASKRVKARYIIQDGEQKVEKEEKLRLYLNECGYADVSPHHNKNRIILFETHRADTHDEINVYPDGWDDNDVKDIIVREAFQMALSQIRF